MALTRSFKELVERNVAVDAAFGKAELRDYIKGDRLRKPERGARRLKGM